MEEGSIGVANTAASTASDAAQEAAVSPSSPLPPSPSPSPAPSDASAPSAAAVDAASSSSSSRSLPAADDCCICFNGDSEENDPILFCDGPGCSCVVHQSCYGVVSIPDGDWYCDMCAVKREPALASHPTLLSSFNRCLLCHHSDGAFKRSETGHWVHAACAIWTPETGFADAEKVDTVIGIDSIDRNRWRLICDVCGVRGGTCVQCLGSACRWSAHVLCAWKAGYRLELAAVGAGDDLDVVKLVYCDRHRNDAYVKGRGGGRRGVRLNDSALSAAAAASPGAAADGPGRGRRRGQDAALEPAGYRCIRCGSRSRQHECSRQVEGEAEAEAIESAEAEQEGEDEELQLLYERTVKEETEEEKKDREEQEAVEDALWEAEREEMEREKEERRRQERERREKERSDAAAARADAAIGAGTATAAVVLSVAGSELSSLYEEMKRAQEQLEDDDGLTDDDAEQQTRKRRRRAAVDESYRQAGPGGGLQGGKKRGRPPGSKTRVRRCLQHTEVGSRCPRSCPGRPPPYTEEELKEREEKQRRRDDGEVRTRRKRQAEEDRMSTTAPGQRKLLRDTRQQTAADQQQQQTPISAHVITSPTVASASSSSSSSSSSPPSSSSPRSPPASHPPAHPQPVLAHPIPPPPIAVVPPLSSSLSAVLTRPDRPLAYNPKETEDIAQRVQALLSCSSPPQQTLLLRQLLLDSPLSYYREVERRIRAEQGMDVLVRWMREARAVSAWGLLSVLMETLHRMCSRQWEVEPALVREIVEEVTRSRAAMSEGLRRNAEKLWTKLLDVGVVTEQQLKVKDSSSSSSSMLAALNAQLAAFTQPSAAEGGAEADGIAAGVKKRKLVVIPSLSSPPSPAAEQKQDRSAPSLHPSPAEVKAAMERQRGRQGLRHKKQQGAAPAAQVSGGMAVSAVSKYRQQQAREAEELKRRERAMEREYQAGIEQQQLSLHHQQHQQHHNGDGHHHDAYQYQHQHPQHSPQPHSHLPYPPTAPLPPHFPSAAQGITDALAAANQLMGHLRHAASGSASSSPASSSSSSSALHPHSSPVEAASLALQQLQKLRQLTAQADGSSPTAAGGMGGGTPNGHSAGGGLLTRMVSSVSKTMGWGGGGDGR